jgi:hypothetical protein
VSCLDEVVDGGFVYGGDPSELLHPLQLLVELLQRDFAALGLPIRTQFRDDHVQRAEALVQPALQIGQVVRGSLEIVTDDLEHGVT